MRLLYKLLFFGLLQISALGLCAQDNYVLLPDASGVDRSGYELELESSAIEFMNVIDEVNQYHNSSLLDVKLYDAGLYLHNTDYEENIDDLVNKLIENEGLINSQYLLFVKISNEYSIYSDLKFYSNLPEGDYCFNNEDFQTAVQSYIDYQTKESVDDVFNLQNSIIPIIVNHLKIKYICCIPSSEGLENNKKSNSTECSEEDILANFDRDIAENYILNYLTCNLNEQIGNVQLAATDPLYRAINKLESTPNFICRAIGQNIYHYEKVNLSTSPVLTPPGVGVVNDVIYCQSTDEDIPVSGYKIYDFGCLRIYTRTSFDLLNYIGSDVKIENKALFIEAIDYFETNNQLTREQQGNLAAGLGCYFEELDPTQQYDLFKGLLHYDHKQNLVENWAEISINILINDYSGLIFYIVSSIQDTKFFFSRLYGNPQDVSKLIEFTTNSGYSNDLRLTLLDRYTEFIALEGADEDGLFKNVAPLVIPYEAPNFLVVFKEPNYIFENNELEFNINMFDFSETRESTRFICGTAATTRVPIKTHIGEINYLDPVILPHLTLSGSDVNFQSYVIPAFVLPMVSGEITDENNLQSLLLAIDIASIFVGGYGGFQLISRGLLRYKTFQVIFSGTEVLLPLSNLFLRLSETCQGNNFCKELSTYLTILEVLSIAPSLVINSGPALNKAVFDLENKITDVAELRRLRLAQPNNYLVYRLENIPPSPPKPNISQELLDYAGSCIGSRARILNELEFDVLREISETLTDANKIDKFVLDLNASKAVAFTQAGDALDVTGDLVHFVNANGGGVKAWNAFFLDELIRTNTTWLQKLDDYLTVSPNKLDEVTDMFAIEKGKNRVAAYLKGLLERKHYDGIVYRGDKASVTPDVAFSNGIPAQGSHDNLIKHLDGGGTNKGNFVSTSKDITIADGFANNNGYVFKVKSRNGKGVDVNNTLGDEVDNWFPEQIEVSMSGGINKADIIGAYPKGSYADADFIPNPNYVP